MKNTVFIIVATAMLLAVGNMQALARVHVRGNIWLGPGGWGSGWGPGWGWPGYSVPLYTAPPVVIQQQPTEFIMQEPQQEAPTYWYYCRNPEGYYPYVKQCPEGWMKVVPQPPAKSENKAKPENKE